MKTILILAPHTDDGELGCGGTIAKSVRAGARVSCVAFSSAEESVPKGFDKNVLKLECRAAADVLGIQSNDLEILSFPVRHFPQYRQDILEYLVALNQRLRPDLVIMPSTHDDLHQDHSTIAQEGLRAFKKTTVLSYEVPWNSRAFPTTCFVRIDRADLDAKKRAIDCYESQKGRSYANADFVTSLAIMRGGQIGVRYAEVFDVVRWII